MDASSGAAVVALDPRPGDHVLDLCCAPGKRLNPTTFIIIHLPFLDLKEQGLIDSGGRRTHGCNHLKSV